MCRYPGNPHWKLASACKTQYAAQHGWEHFLVCHRRLISLLDLWRDFGADVKVTDEGEFWETRSVERLRERLGTYDRLVAAMAGALKDSIGKGPQGVQAEIFNDARFERLEAEGRAEFATKIEEARRRIEREAYSSVPLTPSRPQHALRIRGDSPSEKDVEAVPTEIPISKACSSTLPRGALTSRDMVGQLRF